MMRSKVSKKNHYYLPVHRYYELVHRCRQYRDWKKEIRDLIDETDISFDPTGNKAARIDRLQSKVSQLERTAKETDELLSNYILEAVTEGKTYNYLRQLRNVPCSRDIFYELLREFYWRLSYNME